MDYLPYEIIYKIAIKLSAESLINLCQVNSHYFKISNDWHLWSTKAKMDFKFPGEKFFIGSQGPIDRYFTIRNLLKDDIFYFEYSIENKNNIFFDILINYVDVTYMNNYFICLAVDKNNLYAVDKLLEFPQVDPTVDRNSPIIKAVRLKSLALVDRLLKDPRVDPAAERNYPILAAVMSKSLALVDRLLKDPRVDPSDRDYATIKDAQVFAYCDIVNRLAQDYRLNNYVHINELRSRPWKD